MFNILKKEKKAVLLIHGFAGGIYDEEDLAINLELAGFDTFTFTLPGHDKNLFNKVTKEEWISSCEDHLKILIEHGYKDITVIGHSMGGVLASYLASHYKEVTRLILAAPAFKYMTFGEENFEVMNAIKNSPKLFKDYSKTELISRIVKFPKFTVKQFMQFIDDSQDLPKNITCPILIFQGTSDKVVPKESSEFVYNNVLSKNKKIVYLDKVTHSIFKSKEFDKVCGDIKEFINEKNFK